MLPTFFIAGVAKAGTSSMRNYLLQHPDIYFCVEEEPHHFSCEDDGWPGWAVRDRDAYEALFSAADPSQMRGEASTWTLYSQGAPRRIAQAIPDARFIVLLRNPPDRAFSNWTFNYARGYDLNETFEAALAEEPRRIHQGSPWHLHYVNAGYYHKHLSRYLEYFDMNQIHVILTEDLKEDAESVVSQAYEFLGVDTSYRPDVSGVHNQTVMPKSRWLYKFSKRSNPLKSALKVMIPSDLGSWLNMKLKEKNQTDMPKMNPDTRQRLNGVFRSDVDKLSELAGRDLSSKWLK